MTPQTKHRLLVESTESLTSQEIVEKINNVVEHKLGSVSSIKGLRTQRSSMRISNKPYNRSIKGSSQQIQSSTGSYKSVDVSKSKIESEFKSSNC